MPVYPDRNFDDSKMQHQPDDMFIRNMEISSLLDLASTITNDGRRVANIIVKHFMKEERYFYPGLKHVRMNIIPFFKIVNLFEQRFGVHVVALHSQPFDFKSVKNELDQFSDEEAGSHLDTSCFSILQLPVREDLRSEEEIKAQVGLNVSQHVLEKMLDIKNLSPQDTNPNIIDKMATYANVVAPNTCKISVISNPAVRPIKDVIFKTEYLPEDLLDKFSLWNFSARFQKFKSSYDEKHEFYDATNTKCEHLYALGLLDQDSTEFKPTEGSHSDIRLVLV